MRKRPPAEDSRSPTKGYTNMVANTKKDSKGPSQNHIPSRSSPNRPNPSRRRPNPNDRPSPNLRDR
jgi:hypothetical protein